ncbi:MAG: glycosyltransferase, partial [Eubacteriales bacterium]
MKILMATMAMDIGGAETHIVELCRELRHHDHTIIVASAGGVYVPQLEEAGILHITVPMKRRNLKDMISSYRILKSIIKEHSPDVVHAHARIPAFLCGILQKKLHFPFVTTAHGVFRTGGGLRYLTNWGEGVIAVSEDIKTYLIEEYHYPADKISLTINGIDTQAFSSQTPPDPTYQRTGNNLCHVSRLDKDPAIVGKYLIDLAPDLATVIPNFSLLIVGGGDQLELMKEQAKRANDKIGRECVLLTGASTKVNEQIMLGDLFVGISRCALEAMASEKTVILAGIAGYQGILTPEGLQEATEGNFCCRGMTPLTKDLLKEGILQGFALTQEERATLGTFGRQVIEEHYSVGRMANDYLARYQDAITPQYKVVISGYYGFENAGDDAILQSIHHQINSATQKEQVEITVLSNNPRATTEHYGLTAVHRLHIPAVIRAISASDALLSGGGSLIQDRTSTRSLLYYLSIISLADHLRKPIMLYANGIGPVDKPYNRKRVKKVLDRATVITLRDQDSANELAAIGVDQKEIKVTADPVLNMIPAGHNRAEELIQELGITDELFVVSVRNWKGKP